MELLHTDGDELATYKFTMTFICPLYCIQKYRYEIGTGLTVYQEAPSQQFNLAIC